MHANGHDRNDDLTTSIPHAVRRPTRDPGAASAAGASPDRGRLNWALIAGLSALALLWPLAELTGMPGGFGRAAVILSVTVVCWIGVVGLGRFPRPVLTLTLTGLGAGVVAHALAFVFGGGPGSIWALPVAFGMQAGWGALAGLLAWTIQLGIEGRGRR